MDPLENGDFSTTDTLTTESAAAFILDVAQKLGDDGQHLKESFVIGLARLSALVDDSSEWAGRSLCTDKLFDRYTKLASNSYYEVNLSLEKEIESRSSSNGKTVWWVSIDDVPYNPDNQVVRICDFYLIVSSYRDLGTKEILRMMSALLQENQPAT